MASVIIALIGIVSGGAAFKLLQLWFGKDKSIRDELREDIEKLKLQVENLNAKVDLAERQADIWRERLWTTFMEYKTLRLSFLQYLIQSGIPVEAAEKIMPPDYELGEMK